MLWWNANAWNISFTIFLWWWFDSYQHSWYQTLTFYKKWYLKQEACWSVYGTSCKKLKLKGGNHAVNKVFTMLDGPGHRGKIMLGGYQMMLGLSLKKLVLCS